MIIHHIAPENKSSWHPLWIKCYESWKKVFGNKFEFKLWNDKEDIDRLVKNKYNKFYDIYRSFPAHIMKIDFARLCILHSYGGIYSDMDVFCYKDFTAIQDEIITVRYCCCLLSRGISTGVWFCQAESSDPRSGT